MFGGGHGNPLQYSCLENPMDRGAWQAIVHRWQDILKVMKENNLQPSLLYPARISFKYEGEIKSFTDKQKLREFSTTKPALQ